ncbi:hypothetical protein [Rhizobium sp. 2MFCol3.1]|uniref:hypothetical protein n=1 Tax=Rhizobium sp. 2MFCol3.1 TaxID=1246459 RepID=UPI0018CAF037|nr:hypothetical protein [Rhizobium sp. 2MFCol3.1]
MKAKLSEINSKIEELQRELVVLDDQKVAFETVIKVYSSSFEMAAPPSEVRRASSTMGIRFWSMFRFPVDTRHIGGQFRQKTKAKGQRLFISI